MSPVQLALTLRRRNGSRFCWNSWSVVPLEMALSTASRMP